MFPGTWRRIQAQQSLYSQTKAYVGTVVFVVAAAVVVGIVYARVFVVRIVSPDIVVVVVTAVRQFRTKA